MASKANCNVWGNKMATSELEQVITINENVIIKEEIFLEDTEQELQKCEWDYTAYSVKLEPSDLELAQNWPVIGLVKNEAPESSEENKDVCFKTENIKSEPLDVQKDLIWFWPKNELSSSSEQIEVMTESAQELCAGKKNIIRRRHSKIHKNDGQVVLKNLNLRNCDTSHGSTRRQQDFNAGEKITPPNLVIQNKPVKRTKTKNYVCDVCSKSFSRRYRLVRHKLIHEEVKHFHCDVCNKSFKHSYSFSRHKLIHSGEKNYRCDVCNRSFTMPCTLSRHKAIHSGVKNFCCDICDKTFSQKSLLSLHMLVHTKLKRHKCEECGKTFARANTLGRHKLIHSGVRKYQCDICGKTFARSYTLSQHKLTHMDVCKNQCDICNKIFSVPSTLAQRKLVHEGKKVYQCDKCNKGFCYKTVLKNHKLIHNECKRYHCSSCIEGFMNKRNLKKHVLIHMMVDSNDKN